MQTELENEQYTIVVPEYVALVLRCKRQCCCGLTESVLLWTDRVDCGFVDVLRVDH